MRILNSPKCTLSYYNNYYNNQHSHYCSRILLPFDLMNFDRCAIECPDSDWCCMRTVSSVVCVLMNMHVGMSGGVHVHKHQVFCSLRRSFTT